jgi:hypothetical protein
MFMFKTKLRNLRILWFAHVLDYPFFRVLYKDGNRTCPLHKAEAVGCKDVFGGKMFIDYEYAKKWFNL